MKFLIRQFIISTTDGNRQSKCCKKVSKTKLAALPASGEFLYFGLAVGTQLIRSVKLGQEL